MSSSERSTPPQAARTDWRNLATSSLRRLLSLDSDCAAERTWDEAVSVSVAPRCTSVILAETICVPCAACCTLREISCVAAPCSSTAAAIAAAVEEQGAATQEISRNVQQAAQGTQQVSANITDVQRGATETGSASSQVLSAAQILSGDSKRLEQEVSKFLTSVRAA